MRLARRFWLGGVVLLVTLAWAGPAAAATFTVDQTTDEPDTTGDGVCDTNGATAGTPCTLRAAIQESNFDMAVTDTIAFSISGAGPHVIALTGGQEDIEDQVTIDGYTEPGSSANTNAGFTAWNGTLNIAVDGNGFDTFVLTSGDGTTIKGLRIYDSANHGILLDGPDNTHVEGNIIGVDAANTDDEHNQQSGVAVFEGDGHDIGGTTPAERNVLSGNGEPLASNANRSANGVWVRGAGTQETADGTSIQGNLIGTAPDGTTALGNKHSGVRIGGFIDLGDNVFVNATANNTVVGGTDPNSGNVISGNGTGGQQGRGVLVGFDSGSGTQILGNRVGPDITGENALGNDTAGIHLGAEGVQVGDASGHGNVVSGSNVGIQLDTGNQVIQGNLVGTNAAGTAALPNFFRGIDVGGQSDNLVGGPSPGARNVVSGNVGPAIHVGNSSDVLLNNVIQGNYVGTNAAGASALPNQNDGIELEGASGNTIADNLISGNDLNGVRIGDDGESGGSDDNVVSGNRVGTDAAGGPLGNASNGIFIQAGEDNVVGAGNVIAHNGDAGVAVRPFQFNDPALDNTITQNSIFSNGGLGIDLSTEQTREQVFSALAVDPGDGVTPNDDGDGDSGGNGLQNFPVITAATTGSGTTIEGTLNSAPNTTYRVEFFNVGTCDSSGNGEGDAYIGATSVTTDGSGNGNFSGTASTTVPVGGLVTSTATSDSGATSEFSACKAAVPAPAVAPPPPVVAGERECPDLRKFRYRTHHAPGVRIKRVRVFVEGEKVLERKSDNDIKKFRIKRADIPRRDGVTVKIILNHSNGTKVTSTRTYNKCFKTKPRYKITRRKRR